MGFESIQESISNKNNNGIKNLRQGLVYNRNKKKTKRNVIEGFKEGADSSLSKYKSTDKPTKPWLSSGPYKMTSGPTSGTIMREVGDQKIRKVLDESQNPPVLKDEYYKEKVRNYKGKFDEMRAKEFAQFESALKKFNSAKKLYKNEYDKVSDALTGIEYNVTKCRSDCHTHGGLESIQDTDQKNGMSGSDYKKMYLKFCQAGCTFNGPQLINSCKDSWKGLKTEQESNGNTYSKGASCSAFHDICDKNNNRVSRNQHSNEVLSYKDIKGNKLKNACCSCGGGAGGIPTYSNEGIHHKSCDSLKLHACANANGSSSPCGTSSSDFMNVCKTPPIPQAGSNGIGNTTLKDNLIKAYANVVSNNNTMKDRGEFLFNKINKYDKQLNNLNNEKNNEEETYDQIISNYSKTRKELQGMYGIDASVSSGANNNPNTNYSDIMEQKLKMSKDWSRDVMVEESQLRRRSEEMKFWMWSILAIVVGWATIINFRKKVA